MDKFDKWCFACINLLNILDAVTTYMGLKVFGLNEGNPFVNWHISSVGLISTLIIKVAVVGVLLYWLIRTKKPNKKNWYIPVTYSYLIMLFGFAVVNNLYQIFTVLVHK